MSIRPPLLLRIYVVAFLVLWCSLLVLWTTVRQHGTSSVVGGLFIAVGIAFGYRILTMTARASGTQLVVHNVFWTRTIMRSQIEDFRLSTLQQIGPWNITGLAVLLRDGTVSGLDITRSAPWRRRAHQQRDLDRLRRWLAQPLTDGR